MTTAATAEVALGWTDPVTVASCRRCGRLVVFGPAVERAGGVVGPLAIDPGFVVAVALITLTPEFAGRGQWFVPVRHRHGGSAHAC